MAKRRPDPAKAKPEARPGFKQVIENHPVLVIVGALSLLCNALVGGWKAYDTFFGERALLVEEYVEMPIYIAELDQGTADRPPKHTGVLRPYDCRVLQNDLRATYLAVQRAADQPDAKLPAVVRFPSGAAPNGADRIAFLVIQNRGTATAREVSVGGKRVASMSRYQLLNIPEIPHAAVQGTVASVKLGALGPGECIAVPIAISPNPMGEGDTDAVAAPIYLFDTLEYRRPFGWTRERQSLRPMNNTPVTIDEQIDGLG